MYVHWAVDGREDAPGFAKRIGLASRGGKIKYRHGPLDLAFNLAAKHPVARNFDRLKLVDESYWLLTGELPADRVIATQVEDGEPRPLFWTTEPSRGRVFVSIPGHYSWTFDDPLFRVVLLRGIAWAAANWMFDAGALWVFLAAFGQRVQIDSLLVAFGIANVLAVIPITPGGLGVIELALIAGLDTSQVPHSQVVAAVLLFRLLTYVVPIPFGLATYVFWRHNKSWRNSAPPLPPELSSLATSGA